MTPTASSQADALRGTVDLRALKALALEILDTPADADEPAEA